MHEILILDEQADKFKKTDQSKGLEMDCVANGLGGLIVTVVPNFFVSRMIQMTPNDPNANVETRHALSLHSHSHSQSPFPSQQLRSTIAPLLFAIAGHGVIIPSINPSQHPTPTPQSIRQKWFQNQGKNTILFIEGGYKSVVTKHANRLGFEFGWQLRFHDRIIKNDEEYQRISDYIIRNAANWVDDRFYKP